MRKYYLFLSLALVSAITMFAQTTFYVGAMVVDANNNPVANQMILLIDSSNTTGGMTYTYTTNAAGYFADTIVKSGGLLSSGQLTMMTFACGNTYSFNTYYGPANNPVVFVNQFVVCGSANPTNCNFSLNTQLVSGFTYSFSSGYNGTPASTYTWSFGDGSSGTGATTSHTYAAAGTYQVCLTADSCQKCTPLVVQNNVQPCSASFVIDTSLSVPGSVYLWNTSVIPPVNPATQVSFLWNFGDGTTSTQAFPIHQYQNPGSYVVCLSLTVSGSVVSCTSTFCDTLAVDSAGNIVYKGQVMGFQLIVLDPATMAVEENQQEEAIIFPVPASEYLVVQSPSGKNLETIEIRSMSGQLLLSVMGEENSHTRQIDISSLAAGVYLLYTGNGSADSVQRFVKF